MHQTHRTSPRSNKAYPQKARPWLALLLVALTWSLGACIDDNKTGKVEVQQCPGEAELVDGECVLPRDISVSPATLGPATLGVPFVASLEASGGQAPYSFAAPADQLPPGLALASSGELSGTPTQAGAFTFTVTATDASGQSGQQGVQLTIQDTQGCIPQPEVCGDGVDNNCDGAIDEGCDPDCVPEPEICGDEADNDCDGVIDNGCAPDCAPEPEICQDGLDNDCDGVVDNGCEPPDCAPQGPEVCGDGLDNDCNGVIDDGCEPDCVPEPEICEDGIDNDCDGQADEGCDPDCVPQEEVCDGVDNDCDGDVDEDQGSRGLCENSNDFGACGGVEVCRGGQWVCGAPVPAAEICDGLDNDCDGATDEGPEDGVLRRDCSAPGCNSQGSQECVNGGWAPCAYPAEICDGEDNNCNGSIDEEAPGQGEACGDGPGVCQAGQTVCRGGELICDGVITGTAEVCDGIDNDCDGQIDEEDPRAGEACVVDRCGNGTWACVNGGLQCRAPQVMRGQVDQVSVDSSFIRAWTGTTQPYEDNNGSSWSVLIASDGERIYNVAYGIDGQPFAGWTVKVFVPQAQSLALEERFTIPVNWDATGAPRTGFGGLAADGERLWVLNGALGDIPGAVWTIDLEQRSAAPAFTWSGRDTLESSAEYDWTRDRFWTIQFNQPNAQVFQYPGSGIDPAQEQARFSLEVPVGDNTLGSIATDGRHLYAMRYENQRGTEGSRLWQFGSGFGGTQPGDAPQTFARVRTAATISYHRDGFLYIPDQSNPAMVQRVAATAGGQAEVCDGLDNDCDGMIDEGNLCAAVDLEAQSAQANQGNFQSRAITLTYTVINRGAQEAPARQDRISVASPNDPNGTRRSLVLLDRPALAAFSSATVTAEVEMPEDLDTGEWLMLIEADAMMVTGDTLRNNNQTDTRFVYVSPEDCDPDRFEPNDERGESKELGRVAYHRDLTLCAGEEDWYYIDIPGRRRQRVWIGFEHSDGDLTLLAYDRDGNVIERGASSSDDETVVFDNDSREERRYWFRVYREDQGTNRVSYDLATGLL